MACRPVAVGCQLRPKPSLRDMRSKTTSWRLVRLGCQRAAVGCHGITTSGFCVPASHLIRPRQTRLSAREGKRVKRSVLFGLGARNYPSAVGTTFALSIHEVSG